MSEAGLCIFFLLYIGNARCVNVQQNLTPILANMNKVTEIKCSYDDSSMPNMLWYQQKDTVMVLIVFSYGPASDPTYEDGFKERFELKRTGALNATLKISNLNVSDSAVYYCAVRGTGNNQYPAYFGSGTKLTVLDPKIKVSEEQDLNVTIIKPSEKESCKKTVTLVCVAKDFYPDHVSITWMVGGKPRTEGVATDPNAFREQETEHFTISSRLKVPRKEWNNEKTEFKCTLKFYDGKDYLYKENKVNGIAGSGYTREDYVKSSQMIKLSYGVFIAKSALYGLVIFVYVWRKGSGK